MTTDTDKLVEKIYEGNLSMTGEAVAAIVKNYPEVRAAVIASLCGDVEPVAWGNLIAGFADADRVLFTDKAQADDYHLHCYPLTPLCPASTVAALKARVAELEKALQGLADFHTKPAGVTVELITEKDLFSQAMADIDTREKKLVEAAIAALTKGLP